MDGMNEKLDEAMRERNFYREKYLELNDKISSALYREQHLLREVNLLKCLVWKNGKLVV